jgi:hypothetical protein
MTIIETPFTIAFDGCHKCYVIEDEDDMTDMKELGYSDFREFANWDDFLAFYRQLCDLRFLDNAKLTKTFIAQCEY